MNGYRIHEVPEVGDQIRTPGVSWGLPGIDLLFKDGNYGLIRNKGHTDWSGVGSRRYYLTRYMIVEFYEERGSHWFRILEECKPERHWKRARAEMEQKITQLALEESQ